MSRGLSGTFWTIKRTSIQIRTLPNREWLRARLNIPRRQFERVSLEAFLLGLPADQWEELLTRHNGVAGEGA